MATKNLTNTGLLGETGTGAFVGDTSPTLTTPDIGSATAVTQAPGTNSTLVATTAYTDTVLIDYDNLEPAATPYMFDVTVGTTDTLASAVVTSNGTVVTLTYEKEGGGDLVAMFTDGPVDVDCTPALTATLTPGTDTVPVTNYAYIRKAAPTVITVNTTGFPMNTEEFTPIGNFVVPSAATAQTYGLYGARLWSDYLVGPSGYEGHLHYLGFWIRNQNAEWISGAALTPTLTPGAPDTLTLATSPGMVMQLHCHTTPAFDSSVAGTLNTDTFFVSNDFTTPFAPGKDLYDFRVDTAGNTAGNNARINWVIWGVVSEDNSDFKLMVNVPSGFYNSDAAAIADDEKFTNYNIPSDFKGTGFLIAKLTYTFTNAGGGTLTLVENVDLRASFPNIAAGGTTVSGANLALSNLASVAVNTTLVSDADVTDDLGTQAIRWNNVYAQSLQTGDTAADVLTVDAWDVDGAATKTFITLTANNTPTCALDGDITGVTQAPDDNSTKLATTAYVDAVQGGIAWVDVAGTSQAAAVNTGYVISNAAATTVTLPGTFAVGDIVAIQGKGAAGWIAQLAAGDTAQVGQTATTSGGTVTSANNYDAIEFVGITADTTWATRFVLSSGVTVA